LKPQILQKDVSQTGKTKFSSKTFPKFATGKKSFMNFSQFAKFFKGKTVRSLPECEDGGAAEDDGAGVPGGRVRHHHQLRVRDVQLQLEYRPHRLNHRVPPDRGKQLTGV
jgi:hypothetical protein